MHTESFVFYRATGEDWRKVRSLLNNSLMRPKHANMHVEDLNNIAVEMAERLRLLRDTHAMGHYIPAVHRVMNSWSIESTALWKLIDSYPCY